MIWLAIRAAIFDGRVYREIDERPEWMFLALGIVVAAAIAYALGVMNRGLVGLEDYSQYLIILLVVTTMLMTWVIWSFASNLVGSRIFAGRSTYRLTLRAIGIAYLPGVLLVLAGIPTVGTIIVDVVIFWILVTGTVAMKETQNSTWTRAIISTFSGWFISFFVILPLMIQPGSSAA